MHVFDWDLVEESVCLCGLLCLMGNHGYFDLETNLKTKRIQGSELHEVLLLVLWSALLYKHFRNDLSLLSILTRGFF